MRFLKYYFSFILFLICIEIYPNDTSYLDENGKLIEVLENKNNENNVEENIDFQSGIEEEIEGNSSLSFDTENETQAENNTDNSVFLYIPSDEFKSKYKSDEFNYVEEQNSKKVDKSITSFDLPTSFFEIIFYILLVVLCLFVIYFLYNLFRDIQIQSKAKPVQTVITKSKETEIQEEIHNDFNDLINQAVKGQNYRLAIRYYFLWYLQQLVNKKVITFNRDKTNSDYLKDIQNENIKSTFRELVSYYNLIWYGERDIDETTYQNISVIFLKNIKTTLV